MKKRTSNHTFYTLAFVLLMLAAIIVSAQYTTPVPNPGHVATQILVNRDGNDESLQATIDNFDTRISALETSPPGSNQTGGGGGPSQPGACQELFSYTLPPGGNFNQFNQALPVPEACQGRMCTLLLEYYYPNSQVIRKTDVTSFFQSPHLDGYGRHYWEGIGETGGNNGDGSETPILIAGIQPTSYVSARLLDDKDGIEENPNQWTFHILGAGGTPAKLYLCP